MIKLIIRLRPIAKYLLIVWVFLIIYVSSAPSLPTLKIHTAKSVIRLDYLFHFFEYGVMASLAFLTFTGREFKMEWRKIALITVCLILFSFLDELHQKLIPGRTFNYKDLISNIIGIFGGMAFCVLLFRKIGRDENNTNLASN